VSVSVTADIIPAAQELLEIMDRIDLDDPAIRTARVFIVTASNGRQDYLRGPTGRRVMSMVLSRRARTTWRRRNRYTAIRRVLLTTRQRDLLYHQLDDERWSTPMMLGGTDGSHHSATLAQLVRKGLAERSLRGGHTRNVWRYRRTPLGLLAVLR
jgi:hypothetical protein